MFHDSLLGVTVFIASNASFMHPNIVNVKLILEFVGKITAITLLLKGTS